MSVPGQGNSSYTEISALQKILAELKRLRDTVTSGIGSSATEATLQLVEANTDGLEAALTLVATEITLQSIDTTAANIETILTNIDTIVTPLQYELWDKTPGKTKEYTWINGVLPNSRLVSTIEYKTGATVNMTQTFTYDPVTDEVLSITAS